MDNHSPIHPEAVGNRLNALREHLDMTRADFAKSIDFDATSYGKVEKGKKPLKAEIAFRIAERWGVTLEYIYRGRLTELPPKMADALMSALNQSQR